MVTWKLMGEHMPRNQEEWIKEFEEYQQYPEFKMQVCIFIVTEFTKDKLINVNITFLYFIRSDM